MIQITRYHDISMGHRVYGHESKCAHLHGHNYRFHFTVRAKNGMDSVGRVIDFGVVKQRLAEWLESEWDHKMMLWREDPIHQILVPNQDFGINHSSVVIVDFNPTAENIARFFVETVAPMLFSDDDVYLYSLTIDETAKCSATYTLNSEQEEYIKQPARCLNPENMPDMYYCSRAYNGQPCLCGGKSKDQILECSNCSVDLPF